MHCTPEYHGNEHFVTSQDGVNWSGRKVGKGGGVTSDQYGSPDYHESPIVIGNKVYSTASDNGTNHLMIRSTVTRGTHRVDDGAGVNTPVNCT